MMAENSPEVDGEDSDLKECLLEALRADGTLKQIQVRFLYFLLIFVSGSA